MPGSIPRNPDFIDFNFDDIIAKLNQGMVSANIREGFRENQLILPEDHNLSVRIDSSGWKFFQGDGANFVDSFGEEFFYSIVLNGNSLEVSQTNKAEDQEILLFTIDSNADKAAILSNKVARDLDLPARIGKFQQSAMVLQWEALPYYYEHRLMLIAQTNSMVSPVNEIIQKDFEYLSPEQEETIMEGLETSWEVKTAPFVDENDDPISSFTLSGIRTRKFEVPLSRFWDCLPVEAQFQWDADAPLDKTDTSTNARSLSSLPDPEVVYQIIEYFNGNIEVQAELYFDASINAYNYTQVGKKFLMDFDGFRQPPSSSPQSDFFLDGKLLQISEVKLQRSYVVSGALHQDAENLLTIAGVFNKGLFDEMVVALMTVIRDNVIATNNTGDKAGEWATIIPEPDLSNVFEWFTTRAFSYLPELSSLSPGLAKKIHYPELPGDDLAAGLGGQLTTSNAGFTWTGPMSAAQKTFLENYSDSSKTNFYNVNTAIEELLPTLPPARFTAPFSHFRPQPDSPGVSSLTIVVNDTDPDSANWNWTLTWAGEEAMTEAERDTLKSNYTDSEYRAAIDDLHAELNGKNPNEQFLEENKINESVNILEYQVIINGRITEEERDELKERVDNHYQSLISNPFNVFTPFITKDSHFRENDHRIFYEYKWIGAQINQMPFLKIKDSIDLAYQASQEFYVIEDQVISYPSTPFITKVSLEAMMPTRTFDGLEISEEGDTTEISWTGADNWGIDASGIAGFKQEIDSAEDLDPNFKTAFNLLLDGVAAFTQSVNYQTSLLIRIQEPLTVAEQNEFRGLFTGTDLSQANELLIDLEEWETLNELYQSWFSQIPVDPNALPDLSGLSPSLQSLLSFNQNNTFLKYHGLMSHAEATELRTILDANEVNSLYAQSLTKGMMGKELRIRARKGSASPSTMRPFNNKTIN